MKKKLLSLCMVGLLTLPTGSFAYEEDSIETTLTEEVVEDLPFEPVDAQALTYHLWAGEQISYARTQGLLLSSLGMDYTVNITRLQIAELLVNMIEQYTGTELGYTEVSFSDTENLAVLKASQSAIVGGKTPQLFFPNAYATRQEIAVMMYSSIKTMEALTGNSLVNHDLIPLSGYEDFSSADAWAKISIAILANHNIMVGHSGKLSPMTNASIQECIVLVNNLYKLS